MSKPQRLLTVEIVAISIFLFAIPTAFSQINNIQVSNLTSSSVTISWTTTDSTDGCVHYGLTTSLGDTACDSRPDDDIHFVQLSGLSTDTTYYFEVASGGEIDSNGGSYYTFATARVGTGIPYIIFGMVYPPDGRIVSVVAKSSGGDLSSPLAALNDSMGVWFLNLGNLKDPATNDVFSYSVGDSIFITAEGGTEGQLFDTTSVSGDSPQDCGPLGPVPRGDVNGDGIVDVGDVVYLVSYLFKSGSAPNPIWIGDVNCDDIVDIGDIVYLVSYLYKGGPAPLC